jgi:hypothetical protein
VSLKAYIEKISGGCPLCGHRDHEESKDEKATESKFCHLINYVFMRYGSCFKHIVCPSTSIFSTNF